MCWRSTESSEPTIPSTIEKHPVDMISIHQIHINVLEKLGSPQMLSDFKSEQFSSISSFRVEDVSITIDDCSALNSLFKIIPITVIEVHNITFEKDCCLSLLFRAISNCTMLKRLVLSSIKTKSGDRSQFDADLTESFDFCSPIAKSIQELYLIDLNMSKSIKTFSSKFLKHATSLKELCLNNNPIGKHLTGKFGKNLPISLNHLMLDNCELNNMGLWAKKHFKKGIETLEYLFGIELSSNDLTDIKLLPLLPSIPKSKNLKLSFIDMSKNKWKQKDLISFVEKVKDSPSLAIALHGCERPTSVKRCPNVSWVE
ncbi:hypothetical protein ADUPG1_006013 [Aduncisulcus paluster]|uniref:Uncharacterized protein n=1 Tax=Aduncisulcus paluster TaxID=2918883 RepID=A0ABQ5KGI8_9EUKA|nr:hypothetical protein ADUPG1_006013 [Aduncisulcus paluster]